MEMRVAATVKGGERDNMIP